MNVNISPSDVSSFLNLALFVGQIAMIYFYRKVERKKMQSVIDTNKVLITSVSDLVKTLSKMLERRTIETAVAQAKADQEEEFRID